VFVEKKGECGVVKVDKVIEISGKVSVELRVGNSTLERKDTDRFQVSKRECR